MEDHLEESANLIKPELKSTLDSFETVQPVVLQWKDITFTVDTSPKPLQVLKSVSGYANPNEIYAIMGSSGSGKTSLLSLLSNQLDMESKFNIKGEIWLNSTKQEDIETNSLVRYIPQENVLYEVLTPYEFLKFTLCLKVSDSIQRIKARVEEVLEQFKLGEVKHSIIGGFIVRGLSGGEKKRLSIASELLLYPSVLILDEPTSGLDSFMAKTVVSILKDVSKSGVTVIMTIHQPSYRIFEMIDRLALMQLGEFVYQGKASEALRYFREVGLETASFVNPPEFFMKVLRIEDRNNISEEESKVANLLITKYNESKDSLWSDINQSCLKTPHLIQKKYDQSHLKTIKRLFWREIINIKRNPLMVGVKLGQIILFAIMFDLIYPNIDYDNEGVEERKSAIICYLFIFNFIPSFTHSISIACEGQIVRKEIKEGMYSIVPYYIEKFVIELPIVLITVLVLIFSTYYVVDLNQEDSSKVINLVFIGIMTYIHGFTIGIVASAISVNPLVAYVVGGTLASSFMMFSGFFNDPENGPAAFGWIKYLIPNYYLRNAALINEFDDLDLDEDVELSPDDRYSYDNGTIWGNILVTFIHFFAMFFIAILISNLQIHRKRVVRKN